jgi:hypothetical protein
MTTLDKSQHDYTTLPVAPSAWGLVTGSAPVSTHLISTNHEALATLKVTIETRILEVLDFHTHSLFMILESKIPTLSHVLTMHTRHPSVTLPC